MKNIQYPAPKQEYKVLVRCFTYNHSKYIEDALNGFAMQQTNFPFVCIVMDDASTDGEQEVIKVWMERECDMSRAETIDIPTSVVIIVPHKTNLSCTFVFYLLKQNLYGTGKKIYYLNPWREKCIYEALCEGDDYWVDSLKLQKQVDFLDKNPEYGLVHTNYKLSNSQVHNVIACNDEKYEENLISGKCTIATLSVMFRLSLYNSIPKHWKNHKWRMGDLPLWIEMSHITKFKFFNEYQTVYRVLENSASHSTDISTQISFHDCAFEIQEFYNKLYGNKYKTMYPYLAVIKAACKARNTKIANKYMIKSIFEGQLNFKILFFYFCTIIPYADRLLYSLLKK